MFGFARQARVRALEEAFEKLQREFRALAIEASDVYEKTRSLQGRVAKRAALAEASPEPAQPAAPSEPEWTVGLDPVSKRIRLQRLRGLTGRNGTP